MAMVTAIVLLPSSTQAAENVMNRVIIAAVPNRNDSHAVDRATKEPQVQF